MLGLLVAIPASAALIAVGSVIWLTHGEAVEARDRADEVRAFGAVSELYFELESELALFETGLGSEVVRSSLMGDFVRASLVEQSAATDRAWLSVQAAERIDAEVVAGFSAIVAELETIRGLAEADEFEELPAMTEPAQADLQLLIDDVHRRLVRSAGAEEAVLVDVDGLRAAQIQLALLAAELVVSGADPSSQVEFQILADRERKSLERIRWAVSEDVSRALTDLYESELGNGWADMQAVALSLEMGAPAAEISIELLNGLRDAPAFVVETRTVTDQIAVGLAASSEQRGAAAEQRRNVLVALVVILLIVAVTVAAAIGRRLSRRVGRVSAVAERISSGDLEIEPLEMGGHDEVARLADAVDDMSTTLRRAHAQITALAAGRPDDEAFRHELPGSIGLVIRRAIGRLSDTTEELRRRATHDGLTGLLDRRGVDLLLDDWADDRGAVGVILLDLDGFKEVNDTWGHEAGDQVLVEVAARLRRAVRDRDIVARLGGDEFLVVVPGLSEAEVAAAAQRIVAAIPAPIHTDAATVAVGASVGWILAPPDMSLSSAQRRADAAMYEAKRSGKGKAAMAEIG